MRICVSTVFALLFGATLQAQDAGLQLLADRAIENGHTPGIVLGVFAENELELASAGVRKVDSNVKLTVADQMHLGSCTKAFTAVLIARLVEKEKLDWGSTLVQVLPEVADSIHPDFHDITIEQLLSHRAGVPANAADWWINGGNNITERRMMLLKLNLKEAPAAKPGSETLYSNFGFMIAGLMAAKVTEMTWEEALTQEVFEPLGITTAGFGVPGNRGETDQPWGHTVNDSGERVAIQADNAPALGPAGTVYLSVTDWCKFAKLFIDPPRDYLEPETIQRLVTPDQSKIYGKGWIVCERGWAKGVAYTHSGSNTFSYSNIWIAPKLGHIYFVAMNNASDEAAGLADSLIGELIRFARK